VGVSWSKELSKRKIGPSLPLCRPKQNRIFAFLLNHCYHIIMNKFRVYYSGVCFESGDSREQVEKKVHDKVGSLGEVLRIEATALHPDDKEFKEGNYIVSFEGEITVQAESREKAENHAYDRLSHLGQITLAAFKKEEE
jgi:hypothetical protein